MHTKNINSAKVHNAIYRVHSSIFVSILIYFLQIKRLNRADWKIAMYFIILCKHIMSDILVKYMDNPHFLFYNLITESSENKALEMIYRILCGIAMCIK